MRWAVFAIFAYLTLVLDTSFLEVLAVGELQSKPSACGLLAAFICLSAPRMAAMWACLMLGLLLDLSDPLSLGDGDELHLIGPRTLGYIGGGYLVLQLRTRPRYPADRLAYVTLKIEREVVLSEGVQP